MFSLKTNNLEAYLLSLAGYGTYVNVLTLHNLLNVQKLSICRTVTTYKQESCAMAKMTARCALYIK